MDAAYQGFRRNCEAEKRDTDAERERGRFRIAYRWAEWLAGEDDGSRGNVVGRRQSGAVQCIPT
jgi:hypothetical protein